MMDEQLIDEVAHHGVIYNRQKYYLNGNSNGPGVSKYETKDEAWIAIALKLRTDVETCKKRWKYLRERYVSQRKQGDPPVYEHLSRPYLEKMKFLDQHIQPRKTYRNVPSFLTSPHSANSSNYGEYNMDSKSNGSMKGMGHYGNNVQHYHQDQQHAMNALSNAAAAASAMENANAPVKIEADQVFRDFAAAVASQQLQQISHTQMQHHQVAAVAAAMAESSSYQDQFRDSNTNTEMCGNNNNVTQNGGIPSASSSMKSPLSSPLPGVNGIGSHNTSTPQQAISHSSTTQMTTHGFNDHNDELDSSADDHFSMKKPRVQLNSHPATNHNLHSNNNNDSGIQNSTGAGASASNFADDSDDESDDNSSLLHPQTILSENQDNKFNPSGTSSAAAAVAAAAMQRNGNSGNSGSSTVSGNMQNNQQQGVFPANADFLFQLYQQLPQQQAQTQQSQHYNKFSTPTQHQSAAFQRCSEHLLGELVTSELLKMSKERRKHVQKRILEILFFED